MKEIKLTFFATSTPAGTKLIDLLKHTFSKEFPRGFKVNMKVIHDGDQGDVIAAGLGDDVVVFDGSVEDNTGSNYKAINMWAGGMEHFLVVSRTRLPLNFQAFHEGGSPDTSGDIVRRPYSLKNEYLTSWVKSKLEALAVRLPRPDNERLNLPKGEYEGREEAMYELIQRLFRKSAENKKSYWATGRAFISYLSRYSRHHHRASSIHDLYVEDAVNYIKRQHRNSDYPILYYPPGALSSEFMVEYRRWQVVSLIDRQIQDSNEFWVFETDDYYNSWWTLAELASLAYRLREGGEHRLQRIYLCKPTGKGLVVTEVDSSYVQRISAKAAREFMRFLSNSDPSTMAYENIKKIQALRSSPLPIKWMAYEWAKARGESIMPEIFAESESDFEQFQEMLESHAFSENFWQDRIVTCPRCSSSGKDGYRFDFSNFLYHRQRGQFRISLQEMRRVIDSGMWECKDCNYKFRVEEESNPQFVWWPVKGRSCSGPGGVCIEKLPVYSLQSLS